MTYHSPIMGVNSHPQKFQSIDVSQDGEKQTQDEKIGEMKPLKKLAKAVKTSKLK